MKLSELLNGQEAIIVNVGGQGAFRKRITEMGFVKGKKIKAIRNAPLKDPIEYKILDYYVSLRRSEAELIDITMEPCEDNLCHCNASVSIQSEFDAPLSGTKKVIKLAFVGNPNCGKTTLFNYASGSKEHTGNYSGVTVGAKTARLQHKEYTFEISDLPGTYSISPYSPEEIFVRDHILESKPDIIVNILDANNLERNMYLTTQLLDMGVKMVGALNMYDELEREGTQLNHSHLGTMLGMPLIPTVGSRGRGISKLFDKIIDVYEGSDPIVRRIQINYGLTAESAIQKLEAIIKESSFKNNGITSRYLAIKALEKDYDFIDRENKHLQTGIDVAELKKITEKAEHQLNEVLETFITDSRYGFIAGAMRETLKSSKIKRKRKTQIVDNYLTHKYWGIPVFILFMWIMFEATFRLGQYPMDWIEYGVEQLNVFVKSIMTDGPLKDLLTDGIINGVGGVIVFLPNILILFFFISFMEDTGYMARAAFIMDKLMHKMGLHGKSFIPLIMGFGCNVPAIMATRTIEDRNNRLLTMLVNPFMSCSARLPVYILIIGAFFPDNAGTMLFGIYLTGIIVAVGVSRLFKKVIFKGKELPFVMELPPYRIPTLKNTIRQMWHKGSQYLSKMGGTILVASIIIWFLGYFPRHTELKERYDNQIAQVEQQYSAQSNHSSAGADEMTDMKEEKIEELLHLKHSDVQANSYIGQIGKFVEPVMKPLGFDWKMTISLISGIAAKEVVISTMAVIYQTEDDQGDNLKLMDRLRSEKNINGEPSFNQSTALGFMIFTLIYFPCVAVIAAIRRESGSWKWALLTVGYTTLLAWLLSFLVHQLAPFFI